MTAFDSEVIFLKMDFKLTDEQKALQDTARKFAKEVMAPVAKKYDESGEQPVEVFQKAFELGFLTEAIPTEYGGSGLSHVDSMILTEELGAGCAGMATAMMATSLGLTPLLIAGTDDQKRRFFTPLTQKMGLASFCLTEPGAGSDALAGSTTARKIGNDYVINGTKCFISNGGVAEVYTLFATADKSKGAKGFCAFAVRKGTPGLTVGKEEDKLGHRASNTSEVIFEDMKVPAQDMLGKEGEGLRIALATLDRTRPAVAALSVGVARAAMEAAIQYAKDRVQFGAPIAMLQAIQFMLADMAMQIEAARLLAYYSAWLIDQGQKNTLHSSCAKCFASDVAMRVTIDAVQVFGGYGYIKEYPVEKYMRDAKLLQLYEGTNQIQRLVIARELLR